MSSLPHQVRGLNASLFSLPGEKISVSFEFFPPATPAMEETLWDSIQNLAPLNPSFVSVTYGAGGSTRARTHDTIKRIIRETNLTPAAHLTCVGATKAEINEVVQEYYEEGVRHIVALRGDPPKGQETYSPHPEGYENAAALVAGIKSISDFDISVACYPECHPDSPNLVSDLENLKRKIDAGATKAITQFFFETDQYFRFLDHVRSFGIEVPVIPGILPVTNVKQLINFSEKCGTKVPKWLSDLFGGLDDLPETRSLIAATVAGEMVKRLHAGGVTDFHFYTLNRAPLVYAICHLMGLRGKQ